MKGLKNGLDSKPLYERVEILIAVIQAYQINAVAKNYYENIDEEQQQQQVLTKFEI